MQEIYVENIKEIVRSKKRFEQELKIKLINKGKNVFVEGSADREYFALEVLEAVNAGFSVDRALLLKEEGMILQVIHIKDITKRGDLERVRGRIIGKDGKTLKTLNNLTECDLAINNNDIGIIGNAEEVEDAVQAITSLIYGSKQSNVYSRLERLRKKKKVEDVNMGLNVKE